MLLSLHRNTNHLFGGLFGGRFGRAVMTSFSALSKHVAVMNGSFRRLYLVRRCKTLHDGYEPIREFSIVRSYFVDADLHSISGKTPWRQEPHSESPQSSVQHQNDVCTVAAQISAEPAAQLCLTFERGDQTGRENRRMIGPCPAAAHLAMERWPFWRLNFLECKVVFGEGR